MICIKKTSRCSVTKTVLDEEKTAIAERTFRKTFKKKKLMLMRKEKKIML